MGGFFQDSLRGLVLSALVLVLGVGAAVTLTRNGEPPRKVSAEARAVFNAAFLAERQGHYHEAREGYLRALAIDPKMADARYELAILTHQAHAEDEAQHNLEELQAIAPHDPRLPMLRDILKAGR